MSRYSRPLGPVSLEHLDSNIWRPVEKFGIIIPDYYTNKNADIYSYKSLTFIKSSLLSSLLNKKPLEDTPSFTRVIKRVFSYSSGKALPE